jgi:hypothetical protein
MIQANSIAYPIDDVANSESTLLLRDPSMPHAIPQEMTVRWEATSLALSRHGILAPRCRTCGSALALHQPDEKTPEHLLGTCGGCSAWFLIELTRGGAEAFLFDLPNVALIRAALAAAEEKIQRPDRRPKTR